MVGLFASDLDGTLFGLTHQAGREVLSSVRMACDSGRHFALATGRTVRSSAAVGFGDVPVEVVCANGAIILGRDGSIVHHVPMDPAFIEELLVAFPELPLEFVTLDHTLERRSRKESEAARLRMSLVRRIVLRGMTRDGGERLYGQTPDEICSQVVVKVNYRTEPGDDEVRAPGVLRRGPCGPGRECPLQQAHVRDNRSYGHQGGGRRLACAAAGPCQ